MLQGFDFIAVLIGLFAFSQLLSDVQDPSQVPASPPDAERMPRIEVRIEHLAAIRESRQTLDSTVVRSALIGVFTGILPGAGGSIANILAYDQAKKASKTSGKIRHRHCPRALSRRKARTTPSRAAP